VVLGGDFERIDQYWIEPDDPSPYIDPRDIPTNRVFLVVCVPVSQSGWFCSTGMVS
jgi:hypothetical protein